VVSTKLHLQVWAPRWEFCQLLNVFILIMHSITENVTTGWVQGSTEPIENWAYVKLTSIDHLTFVSSCFYWGRGVEMGCKDVLGFWVSWNSCQFSALKILSIFPSAELLW
jgi:hypothetical protein